MSPPARTFDAALGIITPGEPLEVVADELVQALAERLGLLPLHRVPVALRAGQEAGFGTPSSVPDDVELRTDHGPQYTGADCAALVERWGIVHTFAPVGRPTGNAVAERVIRTMKEEVIWLRDWEDADQLRQALLAWQRRYNTQRPHQALGWKTPAEYRAEKLGLAVEEAAA